MRARDLPLSPLFQAPYFRVQVCRLDWLHIVDLGVCCDWLGQLMVFLLPLYPGTNQEARLRGLWHHIQETYIAHPPKAKLDQMTL